ncbi:hypothetical protein SAMN05216559_1106 [Halomicrobium zhouii]|uniref:Uncharacterized protein n=1 Tax=Halomicrobium zhouii TaxID=767519 RepID=A0A1I6KN36_9EURY|nr:hypothetical protein [Halomicrobium zhouii]SFR92594.1 hypothetical protein SAMN05216559_1106 [Halomicrobium zhouii]
MSVGIVISLIDVAVVAVGAYIGTTMALRGFFGREYNESRIDERIDEPESSDERNEL